MSLAHAAGSARVAPLPTWWTHVGVAGNPSSPHIAYYYGPRDPNQIGAGLLGFTTRGANAADGWRALAEAPQLNTFGAVHCAETTRDNGAVLVGTEKTYDCR